MKLRRMCDCVEKFKEQILELNKEADADRPHGIEVAFTVDGSSPTYSGFEYYKKGVKKLYTQAVIHSFCPFCGKEYQGDEEKEVGIHEHE